MVIMMSDTTSALPAGSMASFSSSSPTSAAISTARTIARGSGTPAEVSITADTPPIMMNSPWAKLITPLAL